MDRGFREALNSIHFFLHVRIYNLSGMAAMLFGIPVDGSEDSNLSTLAAKTRPP